MMNSSLPFTRDLVLIGGGHTHALVLRAWGMNPLAGVRLTVINPGPTAPYSGMLPGFVAGQYRRDELDIDLVKLCRFAGARFIDGYAACVDKRAKTVRVQGRPDISYDVLSMDIGITSAMPQLAGFLEHGNPAKPLGPFASKWDAYRQKEQRARVAVIGGGVAGAELALAMRHALAAESKVHLIDRGEVLKDLGLRARRKMLNALQTAGVNIVERADVVQVDEYGVHLSNGRQIAAEFVTGAAGAKPHDWQSNIGLKMHDGFIAVGPTLQSSDPDVFAVGDCAHMTHAPRPKAGVFAVRQAPTLTTNLRARLSSKPLNSYQPQRDYLKLISLGGKSALAEKFGAALSGPMLWRWKNQIDRKFMTQFDDLPVMEQPKCPDEMADGLQDALASKPMCGGCGSKVGRGALREVLAGLPINGRDDVQSVAGDDAAVINVGETIQVMTTDHLRSFTFDPVVMARIAAVHALGDIWAMGANPQVATANIILPKMNADLQRRTLAEIMQAAHQVMDVAGASIVGGHSSVGDELTIGFTVTGICENDPITIGGARPGDILLLTKPIGSGVIMAAEMAGQAEGKEVTDALTLMSQSQARAAKILASAHAMTDVTGFGLAGHLSGMCEASGVDAEVSVADVPVMNGAQRLAMLGVKSSLFDENKAGAGAISGGTGNQTDLLFDPQTAGGLLAAIAPEQAAETLAQLHAAGYSAARIGVLSAGSGVVTFR